MKSILCLILAMLITAPAFGQVALKDVEALLAASEARMMAEFQKINEEIAELKADVAELKTDVATLKTDVAVLKAEVGGLKEYIDIKITASEKATTTEIRSVNQRLTFVEYLLIALVTAMVTVLLWMLKKEWDARREERAKNAEQHAEIAALRAENERLKNASGLVSHTGTRLESE